LTYSFLIGSPAGVVYAQDQEVIADCKSLVLYQVFDDLVVGGDQAIGGIDFDIPFRGDGACSLVGDF